MPGTYYKTTPCTDDQLKYLEEKANRQEKALARLYYKVFPEGLTAVEAHRILNPDWLEKSSRRATSTLKRHGILCKTKELGMGEHGRKNHKYKWKAPQPRQTALFQPKHKGAYSQ